MKKYILLGSAVMSIIATSIAIVGVLNQNVTNEQTFMSAIKYYQIAGTLGLLGISLFFVGLAFPKEGVKND